MSTEPILGRERDSRGPAILIIDDEKLMQDCLLGLCQTIDIPEKEFYFASTLKLGLKLIASKPIDVVLLDKNLKKIEGDEDDGISAIPEILQIRPLLQILVVSGSRDSQDIVRATKFGAFGYATKGTDDELIPSLVQKAIEYARLSQDRARLQHFEGEPEIKFVGVSSTVKRLLALLPQIAKTDEPALLLGESGTGKTTYAKLIHHSRKKHLKQDNRPFVHVDVSSLSPTVIERELFGNDQGAFTDAKCRKPGFFELAHNGTLFLDEIGDISLDIQKKLREAIEEGSFYRVGGTKKFYSSFKLICATNKNLEEMVRKKEFREDLYYRIGALPIHFPPLSERCEDIGLIVKAHLPKVANRCRVLVTESDLPEDFIQFLIDNPPAGNIRGIDHQLVKLLTLSPRDRNQRPILQKWKKIRELFSPHENGSDLSRNGFSYSKLISSDIDTSHPDFPGLHKFTEGIEEKILLDAKARYKTVRKVADRLKLSESTVSIKLKNIGASVRRISRPTTKIEGEETGVTP